MTYFGGRNTFFPKNRERFLGVFPPAKNVPGGVVFPEGRAGVTLL